MTEYEWREKVADQLTDMVTRLALSEQHLVNIDKKLDERPQIRHVNKDGECDAYRTVKTHDERMNQWIGFTAGVSAVSALIGGAIVAAIAWFRG